MTQVKSNEALLSSLFKIAGYGLLALSLLNIIDAFIPPRFDDPNWELQLVNTLVERTPVPLLGLVLVLVGEQSFRIFKLLSWSCLVVGLLFVLLVPLTANSSFIISQQNRQAISSQVGERTAQLQQLRNVLNQAKTPQQINNILTRLNPQSRLPENSNPEQVKSQLLAELAKGEKTLRQQGAASLTNRNLILLKNAVKLSLGALFSSAVFLVIWRKSSRVIQASKSQKRR